MKTIHQNKKLRTRGSALFVTMGVLAVASILIASYLGLVRYQSASVYRSQNWNNTIPLTEAGVEEGLAMLNYNAGTWASVTAPWSWTNQLAANGWSALDTNSVTSVTHQMGNNSYTVTITIGTNGMPVIDSLGAVTNNGSSWIFSSARSPMFAAAGMGMLAQVTAGGGSPTAARKIEVQTALGSLFPMGVSSKGLITINGNVTLDSFDSSNTNYSTGGQYDPNKREANCGVGSDLDVTNAIGIVGSVQVYGTAHTGPTGGASLKGTASVGDLAWVSNSTPGIEAGHFYNDMNMNFIDVQPPSLPNGLPLPQLSVVNGVLTYKLTTGAYSCSSGYNGNSPILVTGTNVTLKVIGDFSLSSSTTLTVTNGASLTMYVTGNVSLSGGSAGINIATNGSLTMYVGGTSTDFSGQGVVNAGKAVQFQYFGLPGNTSIKYNGGPSFVGTVYAPEADYEMGGTITYVGASVARTVTMDGNDQFHYDENLKKVGPSTGFYVTSWKEVAAH